MSATLMYDKIERTYYFEGYTNIDKMEVDITSEGNTLEELQTNLRLLFYNSTGVELLFEKRGFLVPLKYRNMLIDQWFKREGTMPPVAPISVRPKLVLLPRGANVSC